MRSGTGLSSLSETGGVVGCGLIESRGPGGSTLRAASVIVAGGSESTRPSPPTSSGPGTWIVWVPGAQSVTGYETSAESPRKTTRACPRTSMSPVGAHSAARTARPSGAATIRRIQTVSPTVGSPAWRNNANAIIGDLLVAHAWRNGAGAAACSPSPSPAPDDPRPPRTELVCGLPGAAQRDARCAAEAHDFRYLPAHVSPIRRPSARPTLPPAGPAREHLPL